MSTPSRCTRYLPQCLTRRCTVRRSTRTKPISTLFPYTTLFRSELDAAYVAIADGPCTRSWWSGSQAGRGPRGEGPGRSEEQTSELQSRGQLVCSRLLEKINLR